MTPPGGAFPLNTLLLSSDRLDDRLLALDSVGWSDLVEQILREGCAALAYHRLRGWGLLDLLPETETDRLAAASAEIAARDMLLSQELGLLLDRFASAGVEAAPLRGPLLGQMLHGTAGMRPVGDLDLLAPRETMPDLDAVLRESGYRSLDRWPGFALRYYYTLKYYRAHHGWLIVEPRWTIAYPPWVDRVEEVEVRERMGKAQFDGREVAVLDPGDLLLHLCLHFLHHEPGAPMLWQYEIDRSVRGMVPDQLGAFAERVNTYGLGPLAAEALRRVQGGFMTPLPADLLERMEQGAVVVGEQRILRIMASTPDLDGRESLAMLFVLPGLLVRLRYAAALLFPSIGFMRVQYGLRSGWSVPFAYLRRVAYFSLQALRGLRALMTR